MELQGEEPQAPLRKYENSVPLLRAHLPNSDGLQQLHKPILRPQPELLPAEVTVAIRPSETTHLQSLGGQNPALARKAYLLERHFGESWHISSKNMREILITGQ